MSHTIPKTPDPLRDAGEHPAFPLELDTRRSTFGEAAFYGEVWPSGADRERTRPIHVCGPYSSSELARAMAADWALDYIRVTSDVAKAVLP
jgi:hypothetical protein